MMKTLLMTATMAVLGAPALAQTPPAKTHDDHATTADTAFKKHDANADGALTLAEVQKADGKVTEADFTKYDADKSSSLSKEEFAKWAEAKHAPPASAPGQ